MIVGRDAELARLGEALAADEPILVVGEAGAGKTTLLRAAAAASGRAVFEGGALSTLPWLEYLAVERAIGRRVTASDPLAVAEEVEAVVGPGVLLLDDLQWAAPAMLACVEVLAGRLALLVGIRRGDAEADARLDRLRAAGFAAVQLEGLSERAARELVAGLRPDLGDAGLARLLTRTGGNPLLLHELGATGEPSASLRLALAARLRRLDEAGRHAFGVLALAGRPVSIERLGSAGAKSVAGAELAFLRPDGTVEIRHALFAEIAVAELEEDERRELHAFIARAVDDDGEAARHYQLAGEATAAHAAALRAAAASPRPGERASHLAVAASCAAGAEADTLRIEAAWALEEANDLPALSAILDDLQTADADVRATAALIRARAAWRAGDPDVLRGALAEGLALVGGTGSDIEVRLRIEAGRVPTFIDSDPEAAVAATTEALSLAVDAGVDVARARYLRGTALYIQGRTEGLDELRAALDAARAAGDVGTELPAANNLIAFHESMGDPGIARQVAADYIARAHELGMGVWERSFRVALSNLEFHAGNYAAVLETADQLLHLPLEVRTREALLEQMCLALVDLGRVDEAIRRIGAEPERPNDSWWARQIAWVQMEAALWGGQPQRAFDIAEQLTGGPAGDLNTVLAHASRAWALFDLGRDPGPPVVAEFPAMLAAVPHEVAGIRALHHGDGAAALAAFEQAAAHWARYHRRGEIRCLWAAGEAARRLGAADAVPRLTAAEARAMELGMQPLLGRIHRSLRAAGVRRSARRERAARSPLTGREREVLRLVADGLSNADIARRLSVSRHTVVSQIASASAKLGASSRSHAAGLAELTEEAS